MLSSYAYAYQAESETYTGVPYSKLDCQAFVEKVLYDLGVRTEANNRYNWKGSNDIWRHALQWRGTLEECRQKYGIIPPGALVFIVQHDGGEVDRGYHDDQGNASHVGIFVGDGSLPVRDSTKTAHRDGVGYRTLTGFTHVGFLSMLSYKIAPTTTIAEKAVSVLRNKNSSDADVLSAIEILTTYLRRI